MPGTRPRHERTTVLDRVRRSGPVERLFGLPLVNKLLSPARGTGAVHKFIRYSMVSAVAIGISQVTILICTLAFHLSGVASNAIGAAASTPASYELNRKWAWGKHGKSHLWKEVVPFWSLTIAGLLASTGTTALADSELHAHHVTGLERSVIIMAASLFAWGVIWVAKFVIFNRLVFVTRDDAEPLVAGSLAGAVPPVENPLTSAGVESQAAR
ncbi:MAG TPA: GtrA family protein [Acidimicrobiales bacterium]|nr:GtrA family protein [Acidimicrobiales bacterium]